MSARDPLRPPEGVTTNIISTAARKVERLKLRRRKLVKKLAELDDEIRSAGRVLRDVVRDATAPASGEQLTVADVDLGSKPLDCCTYHREGGRVLNPCADELTL